MTLPPERIGDKGQRFEVQAENYPNEGWQVIGWGESIKAACHLAASLFKAPRCTAVCVYDRNDNRISPVFMLESS